MLTKLFYLITFGALLYNVQTQAPELCDREIFDTTLSELAVEGGNCTLHGVTILGSVHVGSGGLLTTYGATRIWGSIEANASGNITLLGGTIVEGEVMFSNAPDAVMYLGSETVVTGINMEFSGRGDFHGTSGDIKAKGSRSLNIYGATIVGGGILIEDGVGDTVLCTVLVTDGGIIMSNTVGSLISDPHGDCGPSTVTSSIGVEKGTGEIRLSQMEVLGGDLTIIEQEGYVEVTDGKLSDIGIFGSSGPIILKNIFTDSDVNVKENRGKVAIIESSFRGDVGVELNGEVNILNCDFGFEGISIKGNIGPFIFTGNSEAHLSAEENHDVRMMHNTLVDASLVKNTGGVVLVNNTIDFLYCVDNAPEPTGSGNTITLRATGQCAQFMQP